MKLTKKLLPALGMLALSTCMMVTSTFAWFSMNERVTATNMSVTAQGDQVYLQIVSGADKSTFNDGAAQTTATSTLATSEILPVNVVNQRVETEEEGVKKYLTCTPYAGDGTLVWVTNIGESTTVGTASADYSDVSTTANENNGKYFLKNTFCLRLDPTAGAETASKPLTVASIKTSTSADDFKNCLNVLVVSTVKNIADDSVVSTKGQVWECASNTFTKLTGADALSATNFSAATYAVVEIYVFFNGDDTDCTQAKLAAAANGGYDVEVEFTVA